MSDLAVTGNVEEWRLLIRIDGKTSSIRLRLRPSLKLLRVAGKAHEITCSS